MTKYDFKNSIKIGIIGGSKISKEIYNDALEVGKLVAKGGAILVSGGMGGVMEAASKGAKEAGGLVVGILPGEDKSEANPYVDIPIFTGLGWMRNILVIRNSDVLIALDGSYGTLSEIAYAFLYKKTVFGIKTWNLSKTDKLTGEGVISCSNPREAVEKALKAAQGSDG